MNYNDYKKARNASWKCLIDCGINQIPIGLSQICRHYGIRIVKNCNLQQNALASSEHGKSTNISGKYYIIVRDTDPLPVQRYTIAHEIGHILLGDNSTEYEAERFAIGILAPACVLWGLGLQSPEDIAKVCNISIKAATIRAQRMKTLYERDKFLTSPLEQKVFEQFKDYIDSKTAQFDD